MAAEIGGRGVVILVKGGKRSRLGASPKSAVFIGLNVSYMLAPFNICRVTTILTVMPTWVFSTLCSKTIDILFITPVILIIDFFALSGYI